MNPKDHRLMDWLPSLDATGRRWDLGEAGPTDLRVCLFSLCHLFSAMRFCSTVDPKPDQSEASETVSKAKSLEILY